MLKVMLEKGLVKRTRGQRGYQWAAKVSSEVTRNRLLSKLLSDAFDGSARGLVSHLLAEGDLSDDDRAEILRLLENADGKAPKRRDG